MLRNVPLAPVGLKGIVTVKHFRQGILLGQETIRNTITNAGKEKVADIINTAPSPATALFKWLAIGNSGTAAAAANTLLADEETFGTLARASATASKVTTTVAGDTRRMVKTFTNNSSGTIAIREAGVFNTSTQNTSTMLGRTTFAVKNLANNEILQVTYDIIVS